MYEMKKEYYTGIEFIDKEHAKLFELASYIYELLHNDCLSDKYDQIVHVLNELKEYTHYHFAHEEAYMKEIGYTNKFQQIVQHDQFKQKLAEYSFEELDEHQEEAIKDILNYLTDWLVLHIMDEDMQIAKFQDKE